LRRIGGGILRFSKCFPRFAAGHQAFRKFIMHEWPPPPTYSTPAPHSPALHGRGGPERGTKPRPAPRAGGHETTCLCSSLNSRGKTALPKSTALSSRRALAARSPAGRTESRTTSRTSARSSSDIAAKIQGGVVIRGSSLSDRWLEGRLSSPGVTARTSTPRARTSTPSARRVAVKLYALYI